MKKKKLIAVGILTILSAFMDITGLPSLLLINIKILDIEPVYWALICNFIMIGIIAITALKLLCPDWKSGLDKNGISTGLKRYGIIGILVGIISGIAFYIGLKPFDYSPTGWKVLVEGILYYAGVAFVEELYIRGLLLNLIEKAVSGNENKTTTAIVVSSVIFGLGHIFGALGQPIIVITAKIIWTVAMGICFGAIYKKTNNLWIPVILHFIIDICALPYCFTTMQGYADISLYIILPAYIVLGTYGVFVMKREG